MAFIKNPHLTAILNDKKLKALPIKIMNKIKPLLSLLIFSIVLDALDRETGQEVKAIYTLKKKQNLLFLQMT
jgi:hypothetical protein